MSKDWSQLVANPDALGYSEKQLWQKLEPILDELLEELKRNGKIETVFIQSELDGLESILTYLDNCSKNHNLLLHANDKYGTFVKALAQFGFDDPLTAHLFLEVATLFTVLTTEAFRTFLLFHSKGINPGLPLGPMLKRLEEADGAPNAVGKLKPFMDIEFRNALAHGLVAVQSKNIILYKNSKFEVLDKLDLARFMMRTKEQNVLTQCLINVLAKKTIAGFFQ